MPLTHRYEIQVRFADTDALGHVNNASYATWTESARLDFLASLDGDADGSSGVRHPARHRLGQDGGLGLILARLEINFRRQVRYGEAVVVESGVGRVGGRSFTLRQRIVAGTGVAAEAAAVMVVFDFTAQETRELPPALRSALAPYLAGLPG